MVSLPTANNVSAVMTADGAVAKIPNQMVIPNKNLSRSCAPMKNQVRFEVFSAPSQYRPTASPTGLKKEAQLPELSETLIEPDPLDPEAITLELDELWSFVLSKARKTWIWIAVCRRTRQVVAYSIGDRSERTCGKLWEKIPEAYRQAHCHTDFWEAYQKVIPDEQHTACGKDSGETAQVERWNNTLRQRVGRFVRKRLSFSKSERMHEAVLRLFLHRYNCELALSPV